MNELNVIERVGVRQQQFRTPGMPSIRSARTTKLRKVWSNSLNQISEHCSNFKYWTKISKL